MFISKEIPTGVINGSNTVFTLAYTPYQVDDIWIDGGIYEGSVSVAGNQLTLGDAPSFTIYVDYFDSASNPVIYPSFINATTTVQEIIDNVFDEAGVNQPTSIRSLSLTNMIRYVNSAHKKLLNHPDLVWDFMMKTLAFDIKADTTLSGNAPLASTSVLLSETSTWPATGRVVCEGEEWNFTHNAADVLTIPVSQATHPGGSEVTLCYEMPADFQKAEELWVKSNASTVGRGIRYNYLDFRMIDTLRFGLAKSLAFRTSRMDSSGALPTFANNFFTHDGYLYLPYHNDTRYGFLKYSKKAYRLTDVDQFLEIPDNEERLFDFIYDTMLARVYKLLKRYDRMREHLQLADNTLTEIVAEHQQKTNKVHARQIKTYW